MPNSRHSLAGTLALVAVTLGLLLVGATADRDEGVAGALPGSPAPQLDPAELARLGERLTPAVAGRVERLRDLRFQRVPDPRLATTQRLRRVIERATARKGVARELEATQVSLRLLGLLEEETSLEEVLSDFGGAAAAYYEPRDERLYLLSDAVPAGAELVEFVLAHELTHALEDQAIGLPSDVGLSDDGSLAESALTEGTATHLMEAYATRFLDPFALLEGATAVEDSSSELPRFARAEIEFAYAEGATFVGELRAFGGWKLVDYALRERLPATTEQILHPASYIAQEGPAPKPDLPSPSAGWRRLVRSSFGEFATRETLAEGGDVVDAASAASGWGSDSYELWRRRGADGQCTGDCAADHTLGAAWSWDSARDAREFERALRRYASTTLEGAYAVRARGAEVRLGIAADPRLAARMAEGT